MAEAKEADPDVRISLGDPPADPHPVYTALVAELGVPGAEHPHPDTDAGKHAQPDDGQAV